MKSFSEIFIENKSRLMSFIRRRIDSEDDAADILQDVFMRLFMQDDISLIEQVGAWLFRAAGNRIADFGRKRREEPMPQLRTGADEDDSLVDMSYFIVDEDASVEKDFIASLIWQELALALDELPEEQRYAFEKTEICGLSFKELSAQTGIPVNTLISRKHYAVKFLRERLADVYDDMLGLLSS